METGSGSMGLPVVCLHGILGTAAEWGPVAESIGASGYRVIVPVIPFESIPDTPISIDTVTNFVRRFITEMDLAPMVLMGNSLGGQVAIRYVLDHPESVSALVLSGSAGLYEVTTGTSRFRRRDREYLRRRAAKTFYDPSFANDALVDRIYQTVNDRNLALRLVRLAKDSQQQAMQQYLCDITVPTSLIWGREDTITPPDVAEIFGREIPSAELYFIDKCGHAPMIETPELFSQYSVQFLERVAGNGVAQVA